jgi:ribonuclease HI
MEIENSGSGRQGDPLSPYLFLLCAEGLTGLLAQSEEQEELNGVRICRDAPAISNLLFADDSLILMQADEANAGCLKRILDDYCRASGQLVSTSKSSIFFSPNTPVDEREAICTNLDIMTEALTDKYLGLPAMVGADRSDSFQFLVDRVCQRINGWKEKILSSGGKEVLLKAIAQAIPSYAMSVFKIPKQTCKGITTAMSKFWWGDGANRKRMHWLAWWKLCVPKRQGGMGFRDIHCFNLALLAKQAWRLLEEPSSLYARVLHAKYFPSGDILNAPMKKGNSFTWQSIWAGIQTFKKGHIWRVGQGNNINIWEDEWIPGSYSRKVLTPKGQNVYTRVHELIDPVTNSWDEELIRQTFWQVDVRRILAIPLPAHDMEDFVGWSLTKTGTFSVRSAYHAEWESQFGSRVNRGQGGGTMKPHPMWDTIWKLKVPAKVKIYLWRLMQETIPCRAVLANRHVEVSAQCPLCEIGAEDTKHMLFQCPRAKLIWRKLGLEDLIDKASSIDRAGQAVLEYLLCSEHQFTTVLGQSSIPELVAITTWYLWWERRQAVQGEKVKDPARTAIAIGALYSNFTAANSSKPKLRTMGWVKPLQNFVKVNVDASFDADDLRGATGAVIRDCHGAFLAASRGRLEFVHDAMTAEVHALKQGLLLAQSLGCNRVICCSDNLDVVQAMKEGGYSHGVSAAILDDCYYLASNFPKIQFEHNYREANMVAHELARLARGSDQHVWLDEPPEFIVPLLVNDVTSVINE